MDIKMLEKYRELQKYVIDDSTKEVKGFYGKF